MPETTAGWLRVANDPGPHPVHYFPATGLALCGRWGRGPVPGPPGTDAGRRGERDTCPACARRRRAARAPAP